MKSFMRLVSPSVCRAPGEVVLRRASYSSSEKWVITNMCPARLSQVTPWGESPLKQSIFEQAFIWCAIRHSSPNTTRNIKLLNSSDFSETLVACSIGSGWTSSNKNNRSPKLLAERWARLWVRGSVLDLARARLELGTTFLGLCLVLDRFRDLIEDG